MSFENAKKTQFFQRKENILKTPMHSSAFSLSATLCAAVFLTAEFTGCSAERDAQGAEKLQFCQKTPPNIKNDYQIILGDHEAQNYTGIKGPVKAITERRYELAKDDSGKWLPAHFSGTTVLHYNEDGSLADLTQYDSTGENILLLAIIIHKSNRKEIYLHFAEENRDFVYFCDRQGRILEQGPNPVYTQNALDSSWSSTDGHYAWEEDGKGHILAAGTKLPSGERRYLYEYDNNDSLVNIRALDKDEKERGNISWEYDSKGRLKASHFAYDERLFRINAFDYDETFTYDAQGRISSVVTTRSDPSWESNSWPPFKDKDTILYQYDLRDGYSEAKEIQNDAVERSAITDPYGNEILIETAGPFIYEGANGTDAAYDLQRIERSFEYYGEDKCGRDTAVSGKDGLRYFAITAHPLFPETELQCFRITFKGQDSALWRGCLHNTGDSELLMKDGLFAAQTDSLIILRNSSSSADYCIDKSKNTASLRPEESFAPSSQAHQKGLISLRAPDFLRMKPGDIKEVCSLKQGASSASCITLHDFPGKGTFNLISGIAYKSASEAFILQQTCAEPHIFVTKDRCALQCGGPEAPLLFQNSAISFKGKLYDDTVRASAPVSIKNLPCKW